MVELYARMNGDVLLGPAIPDKVSELARMVGPFTCSDVPYDAVPTNV